jgi:hypothetical protein
MYRDILVDVLNTKRDHCTSRLSERAYGYLNADAKLPFSRSRSRIEDSRDPENLRFSDDTAVREADKER